MNNLINFYVDKGRVIMKTQDIKNTVTQLLDKYELTEEIPIPIVALCQQEGLRVLETDFTEPDIAGLILGRNNHYTIYINRLDPAPRKRFTIAHELGHYLLHLQGQIYDKGFRDTRATLRTAFRYARHTSPYEKEANRFAAEILMPEKPMVEYSQLTDSVTMAQIFSVSAQALHIRLQEILSTVR